MATVKEWVAGARPRTLPLAVAPVIIGSAAAHAIESFDLLIAALALVVALALQVGVNYANDYSDGIRGTDDVRVGPMRLTGSKAAEPRRVKDAAFLSFGLATLAGLIIVILSAQWWMLAVGAACVLAAWWYTGGSRPYGYRGLGEIMVFVFFGLVATLGTTWAMAVELSVGAGIGAVGSGLIAAALLMANNVRDIPTDREAGKVTLAVRLGEGRARFSYVAMVGIALLLPLALLVHSWWFLLVLLAWPLALGPARIMLSPEKKGPALIKVLQLTSLIGMAFALTYSAALILS
ncbi:1,4-dihydroxy-2-naphthoate polyprenyltransferase [Nesterenkonia sp. E16_7]|uniref:1,4-dihydroxy-2-naphthoate polyprenyltransferase n=1 Tax=unclassified Nesterenkonia TaxID=2629769 RepID=UPI001A92C579|nr:1,4-dihydroxy-2-naphthoate polyprenyltransferase [Nesterenkonia sp. E16_10]MBO0597713.1 1,4-dihydroxy-2-naphthoate polyprenyltransferase [Nesterenkonia sp. E16_7]